MIAAWIRHKDASLTMRLYAHSQDEALKSAGATLGRVVSPSCTEVAIRTVRTVSVLRTSTLEPMTGIEPAYSAWEAISIPERVSDNGRSAGTAS